MRSRIPGLMFCVSSIVAACTVASASEADGLSKLAPLPKPHYFWPQGIEWPDTRSTDEIIRIMGTACVSGEYAREDESRRLFRMAAKHKALIGVFYSPWHRRFPSDLPPTDKGEKHLEELKRLKNRLELIRGWANAEKMKVNAVLFDSERFHVDESNERWNSAIDQKYNATYDVAKSVYPDSVVEWYGSGLGRTASGSGWSQSTFFTFREKRDSLSCSLYCVPEIEGMRETYRRTAQFADSLKIRSVTPWVALATGYRRQTDQFNKWSKDWDYETIYDWTLGRELNINWFGERPERFAPYSRCKYVVFYPGPFANDHWKKHFVAYVLGATGSRKLTLDEPEETPENSPATDPAAPTPKSPKP